MADEAKIREMVRKIVYRTVGLESNDPKRALITEESMRNLPFGDPLVISKDALITPLARQVALDRRITLVREKDQVGGDKIKPSLGPPRTDSKLNAHKTVAIGADHGGYELKEILKVSVRDLGFEIIDCGTNATDSVDYPDYAFAVANMVSQGNVWRGVVIDGAGIGSCIVANKVPGVRAAMCYDQATALNSRLHNNVNVLSLGAGLIGKNLAIQIVTTWLATDFAGGRHSRRVSKIEEVEKRYLK